MELPIQVRFEAAARKKLLRAKQKTSFKQVEIIRLAVDELFKKYPSDNDLIDAVIRWKSKDTEAAT